MRAAVSSVGAVLDRIQHSLHTSSAGVGFLTTLPVLVFACLGSLTPRLAERHGPHRLLTIALLVAALGVVSRSLVSNLWLFLVLSAVALCGAAVANVVLPGVVKRHFPDSVGRMTAVYSTSLAIGATAAAGLTVPIGSLDGGSGGWRLGTGVWAALSILAILPWLSTLRGDRPLQRRRVAISAAQLLRSRTAVALTLFFGFQSMQAYIAFGWYARFLQEHAQSSSAAGALVALYTGVSIPVSMIVPSTPPHRHRLVLGVLISCWALAYAGFGLAPAGGAVAWMILAGIGSGAFPLSLTLLGLRSRSPEVTTSLSAFVQPVGYLIAGTGPVLFGVLRGSTAGWTAPLALLWVALAASLITGWSACAPRLVDDELAPSRL
jgi:CP family cyanate transporter-like MFS transporter